MVVELNITLNPLFNSDRIPTSIINETHESVNYFIIWFAINDHNRIYYVSDQMHMQKTEYAVG